MEGIDKAAECLREALAPRAAEMLALLAELVDVESHAIQPDGVDAVGDLVEARLARLGFVGERVRGGEIDAEDSWLAEIMLPGADYDEVAPVRILRKRGAGLGKGLLLGDLDTAFGPGASLAFPFAIEVQKALGPGVADMKGGLVVLIFALEALEACGLEQPRVTTIVLSPDEQAGSLRSRSAIEAEALKADWCLSVECGRNGGRLMGSRTHMGVARLDVYGREAHAGSAFASGLNAVTAIAMKIPAIAAVSCPDRGIYATVSEVHGGRRRSLIPGHAYCTIDVRVPDAESWAEVATALEHIATSVEIEGVRAELRIKAHRPAMPWTAETDELIAYARRAAQALGSEIEVMRSPAGGSASFAGAAGTPTLDGLGPAGGDLMTDHEYVEIPSIEQRARLLALVLHLLAARDCGSTF